LAAGAALHRPRPQLRLLGTSIASLAWLRPELAIAALVLLLAATQRAGRTRSWVAWGLAALGATSICAFRYRLSGSLLPLAWSAKSGTFGDGLSYAARALIVQTGGLGLGLVVAGAWLGQARERWLLAVLGAHTVAIVLAGGDWMPGFRLFVPVTPLYAQLAAVGAAALLRRAVPVRVAAGVALAFAWGVPMLDLATRIPQWHAAGRSRDEVGSVIAADLQAHSRRVALVDIGYLGYASGREVIDLAGITEPAVAAFPGGHLNKQIDLSWLAARAPDTLVLHSSSPPLAAEDGSLTHLQGYPVEQRLAGSAWVLRTFRVVAVHRYAPSYFYAVLRRRAAPLGHVQ
jgi:hypothetical protein